RGTYTEVSLDVDSTLPFSGSGLGNKNLTGSLRYVEFLETSKITYHEEYDIKTRDDSANQVAYNISHVIIIVVSVCVTLTIFLLIFCLYNYLCKKKRLTDGEENLNEHQGSTGITFELCSPRPFTFKEFSRATNKFHQDQIIGKGGFDAVYKAVFRNGQTAAVKRVSNTSQQGINEYAAEVTIVCRSNHRHLVQLIGWYKIAQGLAKALRYLHEECGQQTILHMDIKSSNVLSDSNFEPKLGDFGLAKLVDYEQSMELSVMAGTRGYLAPECVLTGKVRTHSDVYSFGVVALELATGRKTIDPTGEDNQKVLVKWVQNLYKAGKVMEAVDPELGDDYNELQIKGFIGIQREMRENEFGGKTCYEFH
ncbi:L-type lectin-domain containing receptor kinase IX.1-like protein, partial [Tanacetum coccineum]